MAQLKFGLNKVFKIIFLKKTVQITFSQPLFMSYALPKFLLFSLNFPDSLTATLPC